MKKVNSIVYNKLLLQAQEAKTQRMEKLAAGVMAAIGPMAEDEEVQYKYSELKDELYNGMWKLATNVIKYYDLPSADIVKIHYRLESLAGKFLEELEETLNVADEVAGPLEPPLFGEIKVASHAYTNKRNSYIDLKSGEWGALVYDTKGREPQPGDRVLIVTDDGSTVEEIVKSTLNSKTINLRLTEYVVSLNSQDQAEGVMGGKVNL